MDPRQDGDAEAGPLPERPAGPLARLGTAFRKLAVDPTPLRESRDFRLLSLGQLVSETGRQITIVALFYQVYDLTRSPAAVGLIGIVQLVPLILTTAAGGSFVDALDRRQLLIATQVGFALSSALLLFGALAGDPPLVLLYGAAALSAGLSGIDGPNRTAMIPRLVGEGRLPAAIAINQVRWNVSSIAGPAVAGVVIARFGLAWAYGLDVASYAASLAAALLIDPVPPSPGEGAPAVGWAAVKEGLAFLKGRRVIQANFAVDLVAMIFGLPRALFPVLAVAQFHRGPQVVGALFSALAAGALLGALSAGWVGRVRYQGRAVMGAVAAWGTAIAAFGLAGDRLWLALALLAVAGAADVVSAVFRTTILQLATPDRLRGRLSALHILVVTGGPRLGDLEAGVVAEAFSPTFSVVSGGVACLAGVLLIALLVPELAAYRPSRAGNGTPARADPARPAGPEPGPPAG